MIGDQLQLIQFGGMPKDAKPFHGVGSGVVEIAIRYATDAFRAVVAVQLGSTIYVLHAFQKKSTTGKKTPRQDVDLIKQRYKEAQELAKHANEEKAHSD
jgi:phage-related protein